MTGDLQRWAEVLAACIVDGNKENIIFYAILEKVKRYSANGSLSKKAEEHWEEPAKFVSYRGIKNPQKSSMKKGRPKIPNRSIEENEKQQEALNITAQGKARQGKQVTLYGSVP